MKQSSASQSHGYSYVLDHFPIHLNSMWIQIFVTFMGRFSYLSVFDETHRLVISSRIVYVGNCLCNVYIQVEPCSVFVYVLMALQRRRLCLLFNIKSNKNSRRELLTNKLTKVSSHRTASLTRAKRDELPSWTVYTTKSVYRVECNFSHSHSWWVCAIPKP